MRRALLAVLLLLGAPASASAGLPDLEIVLPTDSQANPVYMDAFQEPGRLLYRFDAVIRNTGDTLDLTGDADTAAARLGTRAAARRRSGAERRGRVSTGGVKRGDEPESQRRQERGEECASHDHPVQRHGQHHERGH